MVLDIRFGSARTESEEKATWIFDTKGKSTHGCQILQTWSRYLVRVWCALCRTGVLGDDRMKLDNVLGLMIEDFLEQRQDLGMSSFQQRLNILPWSRSRFPYVFVTQPLTNGTFSSLSSFQRGASFFTRAPFKEKCSIIAVTKGIADEHTNKIWI